MTALEYTDSTTADGAYKYAIATVRTSNGQQSLSALSDAITVMADSVVPGAPQNLALVLTGQGIVATWQAPVTTEAVTYNLYRANSSEITSVSGLTPVKSGIKQLGAVDAAPSKTDHAYVVTAVDSSGNESPISNSVYLNFALLPVSSLSVVQRDADWPVITWGNTSATVVGYDLYLGPDNARVKLNTTRLTATTYTDTGYGYDDRRYTVVSVDANGVEMARSIAMPQLSAKLIDGLPVKRGLMNRLQYNITNSSANVVDNIQLEVKLGGIVHKSSTISLAAGETKTIPVIVGGYDTLTNLEPMEASIAVTPNEGESVRIVRNSNVDVTDGMLTLSVATEQLIRGGTGKASFTLENTSDVDLEVITATKSGASPSNEMRFLLMDKDNNVLTTQSVSQYLGAGLITLPNGATVARIPARGQFTSAPIALAIPSGAPDTVFVQLMIDKLHYHVGQSDQVDIRGMNGRAQASLVDTSYSAEVTSITPPNSFGDVDVVITGRAVSRAITGLAIPSVPLNLVLRINGFERKAELFTDASGNFSYTYRPQVNDAGIFKVSVVHPDLNERPDHGQFTIGRVALNPTAIKLTVPRNYVQPVTIAATTVEGTTATNLHLVYDAQYQDSGLLPTGVTVDLGQPITVGSKQNGNLTFNISADNVAGSTGTIVLKAFADERGATPVGEIRLSYNFSEARPVLYFTPSYIETGVSLSDSVMETITLENRGLLPMQNVKLAVVNTDGSPAPAWVYLTAASDQGTLAVGEKKTVDIVANPAGTVAEGIYNYKLRVTSDNHATTDINVFISVTQSGVGNALFKASDIYTATLDKNGALIQGLAGAKIEVQNENVISVTQTITTDGVGEALFTGLPSGSYKYRATAANHQQISGRFSIKPGITATQDLFLDYNLVNVEWSVTEITVQDKYDIRINATYETSVPAAVVVMEPASVMLPTMNPGDVFYGELVLTNHGLIRADNLKTYLPTSDQYNSYEFLSDVPDTLEANGRITIPYRITRTTSLIPSGSASGGGASCSTVTSVSYKYDYKCKNGVTTNGSGKTAFITTGLVCSGGGGGGFVSIGGGGGGGGGSGSGSPSYTPIGNTKQCKKRVCVSNCDIGDYCKIGGGS